MDLKKRMIKTYYLLALIIGITGIIYDILVLIKSVPVILGTLMSISIVILFLLSIIALGVFHHEHVHGMVYLLPIYYILINIIFFALGLFIVLKNYSTLSLEILSILSNLFITGFSIYFLQKVFPKENLN